MLQCTRSLGNDWALQMKLKKFDDYLKKRLDPEEIAKLEHQVAMKFDSLKALSKTVTPLFNRDSLK